MVPLLTPGDTFVGLNTVGIYRVSGTNTQIQKLKSAFDRGKLKVDLYFCLVAFTSFSSTFTFRMVDCRNVNLNAEENVSDINNITSVLKLWFRELPDPLFPRAAYQHFLNAASKLRWLFYTPILRSS